MKRISLFFITLFLSLVHVSLAQGTTPSTLEEQEAETVINRFFDALVQGDKSTILSLLDGSLLEKRKKLLNNPSYSQYLITRYNTSSFQITNYITLEQNKIAVDTIITLGNLETKKVRFILAKNKNRSYSAALFRIHEETEIIE